MQTPSSAEMAAIDDVGFDFAGTGILLLVPPGADNVDLCCCAIVTVPPFLFVFR
jgi:hypothetical protein